MAKKKGGNNKSASSSSTAATSGDATDSATLPDVDVDSASNNGKTAATTKGDTTTTASSSSHPVELLQVDTGDMIKVKQVLDEGVAAALLEYLPEHTAWDNLKLFLMFIACAFAMTAQFAPLPFPDSRWIIGFCGAAYFVVSAILQAIQSFIDGDAILWTRPMDEAWWDGTVRIIHHHDDDDYNNYNDEGKGMNNNNDDDDDDEYQSLYKGKKFTNADLKKYGLLVRSDFPRYSEFFTITIQFYIRNNQNNAKDASSPSSSSPPPPPPAVSKTWSVGQFFDKEGYFDEVGLNMEVDKLFQKFDQKQYDDHNKNKATTSTKTVESSTKGGKKPKKD